MFRRTFRKHAAGMIASLLAVSMPLQTMGATPTAAGAASAYSGGTASAGQESGISIFDLLAQQNAFDPEFYANTYADVRAVFGNNAAALENHYRIYGIYEGRMGSARDTLAWRLRVIRRILRFLEYNRGYYMGHFRDADFPWFHAETYLQKYPEVRARVLADYTAQGIAPTEDQILAGAMKHYLDRGALEGKASCSAFDPVWAIVADPEIPGPYRGNLTPGDVATEYIQKTGKSDTRDLQVGTPDGILQLVNRTNGQSGTTAAAGGYDPYDSNSDGDSGSGPGSKKSEASAPAVNFLFYLCGSDLEAGSAEGTEALLELMYGLALTPEDQAKDLQVMVCAGGSSNWQNPYMHSYLNDQGKNSAVYTLNAAELAKRFDALKKGTADISVPAETQKKLLEIDPKAIHEEQLYLFTGAVKPGGTLVKGDNYNSLIGYLINEDTMPLNDQQLSTGTESVSEEPVLSSFLNVAKQSGAEKYALYFWDHGGGLNGGACQDDSKNNKTEKTLYVEEIRTALENADIKLGVLGFDCCLMDSVETAYYLSDYYDYYAASEEVTYGSYAYYEMLPVIAANLSDPTEALKLGALTGLDHRYAQYRGTGEEMDTSVVLDGSKSVIAAEALNGLAKELLAFAGSGSGETLNDHRWIVYDAMRQARIRSGIIGSSTTKGGVYDYVDAGNFLNRLFAELEGKKEDFKDNAETAAFLDSLLSDGGQLKKAQDAVNDMTLANYASLRKIFNYTYGVQKDGQAIPDQKTLQSIYKDMELSGATLYIPYFSSYALKENHDTKKNNWNESMSLLFGSSSSYQTLINEYVKYICMTEDSDKPHDESETERINCLKAELLEGRKIKMDADNNPVRDKDNNFVFTDEKVPGYDEILSIGWETLDGDGEKENCIRIGIDPDAYKGAATRWTSSGDPFKDLIDTMDTMKIYVTRCVEATRKQSGDNGSSDGSGKTVKLDIVVGENTVRYNGLDGVDSAIRVLEDTIGDTVKTVAQGRTEVQTDQGGTQTLTVDEFLILYHDVEDYSLDKEAAVVAVLGKDDKRNYDGYSIYRGTVVLSDKTASVPEDVCLIFGPDKEGYTAYLGAASRTEKTGKLKDDEMLYKYDEITGVTGIQFSHMVIATDEKTGKKTISYADEYDLGAATPVYTIDQNNTVYIYDTSALEDYAVPGERDQNSYHFALKEESGMADVFIVSGTAKEKDDSDLGNISVVVPENPPAESDKASADQTAADQKAEETAKSTAAAETVSADTAKQTGGTTEETADSKSEEVTDEKTEEVTGEKTEEVTGEKTEEVAGEKTEEVAGDKSEEISGDKDEDADEADNGEVSGGKSDEISDDKDDEISDDKDDNVSDNKDTEVSDDKDNDVSDDKDNDISDDKNDDVSDGKDDADSEENKDEAVSGTDVQADVTSEEKSEETDDKQSEEADEEPSEESADEGSGKTEEPKE